MGSAVAKNILRANFPLSVFDIRKETGDELIANGAVWKNSPKELINQVDIVVSMVFGPKEIETVMKNDDGILQGNCKQKGWIDLTTSSPTLMRNLAQEFETLGGLAVDAPVTGSLDAAIRGDMIMFVGGTDKAVENVQTRIRKINPYAKIIKTNHCSAPLTEVLGLNAFSLDRVLEVEPDFLESDHDHEHDDDVTSLSFVSDTPLDMDKFQAWFGNLLQEKGQDILRSKGILNFEGRDDRYVFQGVHMLMDASPMGPWPAGKDRSSRVVFIGRNLESMNLQEGFEGCKVA